MHANNNGARMHANNHGAMHANNNGAWVLTTMVRGCQQQLHACMLTTMMPTTIACVLTTMGACYNNNGAFG
jgi:hypothetical protein